MRKYTSFVHGLVYSIRENFPFIEAFKAASRKESYGCVDINPSIQLAGSKAASQKNSAAMSKDRLDS